MIVYNSPLESLRHQLLESLPSGIVRAREPSRGSIENSTPSHLTSLILVKSSAAAKFAASQKKEKLMLKAKAISISGQFE
jgi:hypothetical protein